MFEARKFVPMILLLGVMAVGACQAAPATKAVDTPVLPPVPILPDSEQVGLIISKNYPEMTGRQPRSVDHIVANNGTQVDLVNFSGAKVDPEAVRGIYDYYGNDPAFAASNSKDGLMVSMTINNSVVPVRIFRRGNVMTTTKSQSVFLVPEDAPAPVWVTGNFGTAQSFPDSDPKVVVVRAIPNTSDPIANSVNLNITKGLAAEPCHKEFVAGASSTPLALRAQEGFCNSLAHAITARVKGMTYDAYKAIVERLTYATFGVRAFVFSGDQFRRMPTKPVIIGAQ